MSNIPDITSLSDLLNTSPSQNGDRLPKLQLNEAIVSQMDDNFYGSTTNDDSRLEVEKLLGQQSEKTELNVRRDGLLQERGVLQANIDELNLKVRRLKDQLLQKQAQDKLQSLLKNNSQQYAQGKSFEVDDEQDILQNLHVLPSKNWLDRLKLIRKFLPYLEIDNIHMSQEFSQNDKLMRILQYCLISPLLFRVLFTVTIFGPQDTVSDLQVDYAQLTILSQSFAKVLANNYIPQRKLPLIMFGLNSLSILLHKRIAMFYKLIRLLKNYIDPKFHEFTLRQEVNDNIKLFATLKLEDCLTFNIPVDNRLISLSLHWQIVLVDTVTGQCESQLNLYVLEGNQLLDANDIFIDLVNMHGIVQAITIILKNSFNISLPID